MKARRNEVEPQSKGFMASQPQSVPFSPLTEMEHLLKVAASITQDADDVWTDIWTQVKPLTASDGKAGEQQEDGFVPPCGWPEFREKLWLLKHYLDSVQRICTNQR